MLLVRTVVHPSPIEGLGLFAVDAIPAGMVIWRFHAGFDRMFTTEEEEKLPPTARGHVRRHGYFDAVRRAWILNGDLAIFMNHCASPNSGAPRIAGAAQETFALRDIAAGEELTCDYRAFDASPRREWLPDVQP